MKPFLVLGVSLLILSACTEREICIYQAAQDLNAAERRIDELRGNISRGYALHVSRERVTVQGVCFDKDGKPYGCPKTDWQRVERPVSIDVADQRRQLRDLQARIPSLRRSAAASQAQCRQTYPE